MRTKKFNDASSAAAFTHGPCVCSDCARIRKDDRMALIEREAIRRGMEIATGPREPMTHAQLKARGERIRRNRASHVFMDEVTTIDDVEASA